MSTHMVRCFPLLLVVMAVSIAACSSGQDATEDGPSTETG